MEAVDQEKGRCWEDNLSRNDSRKLAHMMGKLRTKLEKRERRNMPYRIWQLGKEGRKAYAAAMVAKEAAEVAERGSQIRAAKEAAQSTGKPAGKRWRK